jgi:hypothetical protein
MRLEKTDSGELLWLWISAPADDFFEEEDDEYEEGEEFEEDFDDEFDEYDDEDDGFYL